MGVLSSGVGGLALIPDNYPPAQKLLQQNLMSAEAFYKWEKGIKSITTNDAKVILEKLVTKFLILKTIKGWRMHQLIKDYCDAQIILKNISKDITHQKELKNHTYICVYSYRSFDSPAENDYQQKNRGYKY